jgi:capsular exopolysaccharide synthesis family protein
MCFEPEGAYFMGNRSKEQYALLTDYDLDTPYYEAFHTLFANIRFSWETDTSHLSCIHTLLLTSVSNYAEEAAAAANLAIVAAQSGYKTILVDADLRNPSLQQRFGLDTSAGLSDLLEETAITPQKVSERLQSTFIPGLQVLCAGTPISQGAAALLSPKLEECLQSIRQVLVESESAPGIVIYHSPPVLSGADASLIGALVEQTLLTVIVGRTTREQAKQAQEQLDRAHTKLVGAILLNP